MNTNTGNQRKHSNYSCQGDGGKEKAGRDEKDDEDEETKKLQK